MLYFSAGLDWNAWVWNGSTLAEKSQNKKLEYMLFNRRCVCVWVSESSQNGVWSSHLLWVDSWKISSTNTKLTARFLDLMSLLFLADPLSRLILAPSVQQIDLYICRDEHFLLQIFRHPQTGHKIIARLYVSSTRCENKIEALKPWLPFIWPSPLILAGLD